MTTSLNEYLEIKKEMLQAQLKVIYRHQRKIPSQLYKDKRISNLSIVENILKNIGTPLHISKIVEIAKDEFNANLERDSIVSALIKKINAGKTFIRTAPNTFALKDD